jgi:hypothetical protein
MSFYEISWGMENLYRFRKPERDRDLHKLGAFPGKNGI